MIADWLGIHAWQLRILFTTAISYGFIELAWRLSRRFGWWPKDWPR